MSPISNEKVQSRLKDIRDQKVGATGIRVLLVEGEDDKDAFQILLTKFRPGWESEGVWALADAGSKDLVMGILRAEPTWLGVVDRDEWSEVEITTTKGELSNLEVLPRYCLESYLIVPSELWSAFPPVRQQQVAGGFEAFEAAILSLLPRYLRHGALWKVITPLWAGLRARGFKEDLASERSVSVAQNDLEIQRKLDEWHRFLDPVAIFAAFKKAEAEASLLTSEDQLKLAVHAKLVWEDVDLLLNRLLGQKSRPDRSKSIFRNLPALPSDLEPLVARLFPGSPADPAPDV